MLGYSYSCTTYLQEKLFFRVMSAPVLVAVSYPSPLIFKALYLYIVRVIIYL